MFAAKASAGGGGRSACGGGGGRSFIAGCGGGANSAGGGGGVGLFATILLIAASGDLGISLAATAAGGVIVAADFQYLKVSPSANLVFDSIVLVDQTSFQALS